MEEHRCEATWRRSSPNDHDEATEIRARSGADDSKSTSTPPRITDRAAQPIARRHQYGWNAKEFSDLLEPLRRYLRKQVGRPWDKVWSEITHSLDSRSLTGQHIFDHIQSEVDRHVWLGPDGRLYHTRWSGPLPVSGLYVHPSTGVLCYIRESWRGYRGGPFVKARVALRAFGIDVSKAEEIRRYRVDGTRLWEQRDCGWFMHSYRYVHEQLMRVITRSDGRDVSIDAPTALRTRSNEAGEQERDQEGSAIPGP